MGFSYLGAVGPTVLSDGLSQNLGVRMGRGNELVVTEDHGKYWEAMMRGNAYLATTLTAGIALIISATTGNHPTLWNPNGNPFNAGFAKLSLNRISGTDAAGSLYWMSTIGAGSAINATGGPIITFTKVSPVNALLGNSSVGTMFWAPATNTYTNAPVFWAPAGVTLFQGTVAAVIAEISLNIDYDEFIGIAPGNALSLCTQTATSTALYGVSLGYIESHV